MKLLPATMLQAQPAPSPVAFRKYLYTKHPDPRTVLSKKDTQFQSTAAAAPPRCPPERELVLEDGSCVCANCADCPKKIVAPVDKPRVEVVVEQKVGFN